MTIKKLKPFQGLNLSSQNFVKSLNLSTFLQDKQWLLKLESKQPSGLRGHFWKRLSQTMPEQNEFWKNVGYRFGNSSKLVRFCILHLSNALEKVPCLEELPSTIKSLAKRQPLCQVNKHSSALLTKSGY